MRHFVILIVTVLMFSATSCATHVQTRRPNTSVTVVKTPPKHYKIVTVRGKRYYFWNGNHYIKTRRGYVFTRM